MKASEAERRIPTEFLGITFFSRYDQWLYHFVSDSRLCDDCADYARLEMYAGNDIRVRFPWLMIEDLDVIKVNVHPNCRCYLERVANPMDVRKYE